MNPQEIIGIVSGVKDPASAAEELIKRAAVLWASNNDYCDDISAIVIFEGSACSNEISQIASFTDGKTGKGEDLWF